MVLRLAAPAAHSGKTPKVHLNADCLHLVRRMEVQQLGDDTTALLRVGGVEQPSSVW